MTPRSMLAPLGLVALGVALFALTAKPARVLAAEFWDAKPFAEWSDKDVQRMLTDSPWAHPLSVVVQRSPTETGDINAGGRGGGDDTGRGGFPTPLPQLKLIVQWRSAQPMRQAVARRDFGDKIPADVRETLERDDSIYVVTVLGLPMRFAAAAGSAKQATFLKRDGRPPIAATEGGPQQSGNTLALVFGFPRADAITPQDNEVEFATKLGDLEIKRKFRLKEMVAAGHLQL